MIYVKQIDSYRLGNFINLTPAIQSLANNTGKRIKVHFETRYVKQCFLDCPFIEHVGMSLDNPIFTSGLICKENTKPDAVYAWEKLKNEYYFRGKMPHTYVDTPKDRIIKEDYVLFLNGTGNEDENYIETKNPGISAYNELRDIIKKFYNLPVYITGSVEDRKRFDNSYLCVSSGNIRDSLSLIYNAKFIVANDTGLAHAAAAMKKKMLILWKDTKFPKNSNISTNTQYLMKEDWIDGVKVNSSTWEKIKKVILY